MTRATVAPPPPATRPPLVAIIRAIFPALTHLEVRGLENVPASGPLIVAANHVGHLDPPLIVASMPRELECIALADLADVPVTGRILKAYGVIWVRRDEMDRDVLSQSLAVLAAGRALALAPEGQISDTGALMRGREGAAWLAARSGAPVVPVAMTGTERAIEDLRRLRRPRLSITYGAPLCLTLPPGLTPAERRAALAANTDTLMRAIAALLPARYRGEYA